jgi:hypothetical protein
VFTLHNADLPFCLVYLLDEPEGSTLTLKVASCVAASHGAAAAHLSLGDHERHPWTPAVHRALKMGEHIVVVEGLRAMFEPLPGAVPPPPSVAPLTGAMQEVSGQSRPTAPPCAP